MAQLAMPVPQAAAHGDRPGSFVTAITTVRPAVLGLRVRVEPDGSSLTIGNGTGRTVIVVGYQGEPFLKITPDGVWENEVAPTTGVNHGTEAGAPTGAANPAPPPRWRQVSESNVHLYHDHRIDWMGGELPAVVRNDVNHSHLIKKWEIDLTLDDTTVHVLGTLTWRPAGFSMFDIAFVAVCCLMILVVVCVFLVERRRDRSVLAKLG